MTEPPGRRVLANDFGAQWDEIRADATEALERVGSSGWLVLGDEVVQFEESLARWWGLPHAVGVASGLDALEISLRLAAIGPGDRVLTTPLTAFATTLAVLRVGAEPVWCDVDQSGGMDIEIADAAIADDPTIRAVLPVHLYGHPLDPKGLDKLSSDHDVIVIEDCAQSAGAERDGRPTGSSGVLAATSLYPTKNLGALGDGGVILTADAALADRARTLRNYGQDRQYHHVELGLNSRLDELHAAILRSAMLPRLDTWLARRSAIAAVYDAEIDQTLFRPVSAAGGRSARHLYPVEVLVDDAEQVRDAMVTGGIGVGRHYPFLCPDMPARSGRGTSVGELSVARRIATRELSLPVHPHMSDDDVSRVIDVANAIR
jgi:dTDP-4-amino-4,6-dideoxygalactose transaminase